MRPYKIAYIIYILIAIPLLWAVAKGQISWVWLLISFVVLFVIFFGGVTQLQWNFFLKSLHHGARDKNEIALTFDDGIQENTEKILKILDDENVRASFYLIGQYAEKFPHIVKEMDEKGHLIGNHSYSHSASFDWKSARFMRNDFEKCNFVLEKIIGRRPLTIRVPYGITNPNVYKALSDSDMVSVGWSLRSFDTNYKKSAPLLRRILRKVKGGDILLLHDKENVTVEILTNVIQELKQRGFTFVRVDQLLSIPDYE